jgi:hypothetical protein
MSHDLIVVVFCLTTAANIWALVRYWRAMRMLHIVLNALVETQQVFNDLIDAEQRKGHDL